MLCKINFALVFLGPAELCCPAEAAILQAKPQALVDGSISCSPAGLHSRALQPLSDLFSFHDIHACTLCLCALCFMAFFPRVAPGEWDTLKLGTCAAVCHLRA